MWQLGKIYLLDKKITMMNKEHLLLNNSYSCSHSFEVNDLHVPQCTKCLCVMTWVALNKYLKRLYNDNGVIEYDRLKQVCFIARRRNKSGIQLVKKIYFSVELNKEVVRYFYYDQNQ